LSKPLAQVSPTYFALVKDGTFATSIGESGWVNMKPPFPESDEIELPLTFIAIIFA
jgi:hypothetical protein